MATRQVRDVDDIIEHLFMRVNTSDVTAPPSAELTMKLFKSRLARYLKGIGHPVQHRGSLINEDIWYKEENNPFIRSQLLLLATTESDLVPVVPTWSIEVCFTHILSSVLAHKELSSAMRHPPIPVSIRLALELFSI